MPTGFSFARGDLLDDLPDTLPLVDGVYLLFVKGGDAILRSSGYYDCSEQEPVRLGDYVHLYTGSSVCLGERVKSQLLGSLGASNFRVTLQSLEIVYGSLRAGGMLRVADVDLNEQVLLWLRDNALVGWIECTPALAVETAILSLSASPLNIEFRRDAEYSKRLMEARSHVFPSYRRQQAPAKFT